MADRSQDAPLHRPIERTQVLLGGIVWTACSVPLALLVGALRVAEEQERTTERSLVPNYVPDELLADARRR